MVCTRIAHSQLPDITQEPSQATEGPKAVLSASFSDDLSGRHVLFRGQVRFLYVFVGFSVSFEVSSKSQPFRRATIPSMSLAQRRNIDSVAKRRYVSLVESRVTPSSRSKHGQIDFCKSVTSYPTLRYGQFTLFGQQHSVYIMVSYTHLYTVKRK